MGGKFEGKSGVEASAGESGVENGSGTSTSSTNGVSSAILLDRDKTERGALGRALEARGHRVALFDEPGRFLERLRRGDADLVVLDIGGVGELDIVGAAREAVEAPVVVVGPRSDPRAEAAALAIGADDYVVRPVRLEILLLRIEHLRSIRTIKQDAGPSTIVLGDLVIDRSARTASVRGEPIRPTRIEFDILCMLASQPGHVFTRSDIVHHVWGGWLGSDHMLDTHVYRLRGKILGAGVKVRVARGVGFSLDVVSSGQPG